jgi:hypothetical protein
MSDDNNESDIDGNEYYKDSESDNNESDTKI